MASGMTFSRWGPVALTVAAAVIVVLLLRKPEPPPAPNAEERTEELIRQLTEAGWYVMAGEEVADLAGALSTLRADSAEMTDSLEGLERARAELARQVRLLGGELRATTDLVAQLETSLRLQARHQEATDSTPARVEANFDDGVFAGWVAYEAAPDSFSLRLQATIEQSLAITEGPDRSLLFAVAAADPRVDVRLRAPRYQLPAPVQVCSWRQKGTWAISGAATVEVLQLLASVFGG